MVESAGAAKHTASATPSLLPPAQVAILHRVALAGSPEALLALADRYVEGRGVPKNYQEGLRCASILSLVRGQKCTNQNMR